MTTPTPRKGGLLKRLSYKMADVETKLERICMVTGNVEKLKALEKRKKDIYTINIHGWTPLQVASFNLFDDAVGYMLTRPGCDVNAVDSETGCTVLHMLAWRGAPALLREVVEKGNASLNLRSFNDCNALHYAVCGGNLEAVKYLLDMKVKHKAHSKLHGFTPFHMACKIGHTHIVRYFLEHTGQHVDSKDITKSTGLYHACLEGHVEIVQMLLVAGADRTKTNKLGLTPAEACRCKELYEFVVSWLPPVDATAYEQLEPPGQILSPILTKARLAMQSKFLAPPLSVDDCDFNQIKNSFCKVASPALVLFHALAKEEHEWVNDADLKSLIVQPTIETVITTPPQPVKSALKTGTLPTPVGNNSSPSSSVVSNSPPQTDKPRQLLSSEKKSISFSTTLEDVRYFRGKEKTSKVSRTRSEGKLTSSPPGPQRLPMDLSRSLGVNGSLKSNVDLIQDVTDTEDTVQSMDNGEDQDLDNLQLNDSDSETSSTKDVVATVLAHIMQDDDSDNSDDAYLDRHLIEKHVTDEGASQNECEFKVETSTTEQDKEVQGENVLSVGRQHQVDEGCNCKDERGFLSVLRNDGESSLVGESNGDFLEEEERVIVEESQILSDNNNATVGINGSLTENEEMLEKEIIEQFSGTDDDARSLTNQYFRAEDDSKLLAARHLQSNEELSLLPEQQCKTSEEEEEASLFTEQHRIALEEGRLLDEEEHQYEEESKLVIDKHLPEVEKVTDSAEQNTQVDSESRIFHEQMHQDEELKHTVEDEEFNEHEEEATSILGHGYNVENLERKVDEEKDLRVLAEQQRKAEDEARFFAEEEARLLRELRLQAEEEARYLAEQCQEQSNDNLLAKLHNAEAEAKYFAEEEAKLMFELGLEDDGIAVNLEQGLQSEVTVLLDELRDTDTDLRQLVEQQQIEKQQRLSEVSNILSDINLSAETSETSCLTPSSLSRRRSSDIPQYEEEEELQLNDSSPELSSHEYEETFEPALNDIDDPGVIAGPEDDVRQGTLSKDKDSASCESFPDESPHTLQLSDFLSDDNADFSSSHEEKETVESGVAFCNELNSNLRRGDANSMLPLNTQFSGQTPPPHGVSDTEGQAWLHLNSALLTASQLENCIEENTLENTNFDLRGAAFMAVLSRVRGNLSIKRKVKCFYQWKYMHVGGVEAAGPVLDYVHNTQYNTLNSTSTVEELTTPYRTAVHNNAADVANIMSTRIDAGMRFAIRVLDKYLRRLKEEDRKHCLEAAWCALKSGNAEKSKMNRSIGSTGSFGGSGCDVADQGKVVPHFFRQSAYAAEHQTYNEDRKAIAMDLSRLGSMPDVLHCVFKANEAVLWAMFTFYVQQKLLIPSSSKSSKNRNFSKRIMSIQALYTLLHDFGICPMLLSRTSLQNAVFTLLQPGQLPTIFKSAASKLSQSEAVISFHSFCKLLWVVARDCLDKSAVHWNPLLLLLKLFNHMDTSGGRRKMAANSRDARLLPPFCVADPIFQFQAERYDHSAQEPSYSCDWYEAEASPSPQKTPQTTDSSRVNNPSMATLLKDNYPSADTPLVGSVSKSPRKPREPNGLIVDKAHDS